MQRKTPSKTEVLRDLETMLKDVLTATGSGRSYARMARAHGYVDGFMRGLLDTGFVSKEELLELVARERTRASGPATSAAREELDASAERTAVRGASEVRGPRSANLQAGTERIVAA